MAQQTINIGSTANDGTGDDLRTGGGKINDNFTELYALSGNLTGLLSITRICASVPTPSTVSAAVIGYFATVGGSQSSRTLASTTFLTSCRRQALVTAGTANAHAYRYSSGGAVWIGSAAGRGGFNFFGGFGIETKVANGKAFFGLAPDAAWSATDVVSNKVNIVGIGWDAGDANMQVMHNDGSGTATKVDLGANFPVSDNAVYELTMACSANGTSITYTVERKDSAFTASGTLSTNLPANTVFLTPHTWSGNGTTASAQTVCELGVVVYDKQGD